MKFQAIAYPLVILVDVLMFVAMFKWNAESLQEFQEKQLDVQVNYATTAGVQLMLNDTSHIATDYADWGDMKSDPYMGYNGFMACLTRSFGFADTPENREAIESDYMKFLCIATFDGYYMKQRSNVDLTLNPLSPSPTEVKTMPLVWTPKIPYGETVQTAANQWTLRAYNLNYDSYYYDVIQLNGTTPVLLKHDTVYENKPTMPDYVNSAHQRAIVTTCLNKAINAAIFADMGGANSIEYFIPFEYSEFANSNGIEGPSIITYITKDAGVYKYEVSTFSVGGSKIDDAEWYICYILNDGRKLYCNSKFRTMAENKYNSQGFRIDHIFPSMEEAASSGFYYDTTFMDQAFPDL